MMIGLEYNEAVAVRQKAILEAALSTNPDTEKRLRKIIRDVLSQARAELSQDATGGMGSDPRDAHLAVRMSVYKAILGGNINILQSRRAGSGGAYVKPRKLDQNPHQRGGNRRPRSAETERMDGYYGKDRGFVLRFLNSGTNERETAFGRRGGIGTRNVFGGADAKMEQAADAIGAMIDEEFGKLLNGG